MEDLLTYNITLVNGYSLKRFIIMQILFFQGRSVYLMANNYNDVVYFAFLIFE